MLKDSTANRIIITLALWAIVGGLYLFIGHAVEPSGLREYIYLSLDDAIPYIPATIYFYTLAFYVPLALAFVLIKGFDNFLLFNLTVLLGGCLNFLIFIFWPVGIDVPQMNVAYEIVGNYPYEIWQIPGDWVSPMIQTWIHAIDSTNNTIPSTHINYAFILAFAAQRDKSKWSGMLFFFAIGLMLVIVTTKQHYFLDGIAGFVLGWISFKIVFSVWMRQKIASNFSALAPIFNRPTTDDR